MNKLSLAALAIAIAATIGTAALAVNDNDARVLNEISGYQQWTKVNADPVKVEVPTNGTDVAVSSAALV